jgi:hypothetical protein
MCHAGVWEMLVSQCVHTDKYLEAKNGELF